MALGTAGGGRRVTSVDRRRSVGAVGPPWARFSHGCELPVAGGGGAPPPPPHPHLAHRARRPTDGGAAWRPAVSPPRPQRSRKRGRARGREWGGRGARRRWRGVAAVAGTPALRLRRPSSPHQAAAGRVSAVGAGGCGRGWPSARGGSGDGGRRPGGSLQPALSLHGRLERHVRVVKVHSIHSTGAAGSCRHRHAAAATSAVVVARPLRAVGNGFDRADDKDRTKPV